jgi:hypothetical protein
MKTYSIRRSVIGAGGWIYSYQLVYYDLDVDHTLFHLSIYYPPHHYHHLSIQIVFGGVSSELGVGFMIGVAAMMTQLFFVLMCVFFVLATEAQTAGYGK